MYARSWASRNTVWLGHMDRQSYSTILQFHVACCPKSANRFSICVNWMVSCAVIQKTATAVSAGTKTNVYPLSLCRKDHS